MNSSENNEKNNYIKSKANYLWQEIKSLSLIAIIAIAIRIFLLEPYYVPTSSMVNSLLIGDYVFATKYNYGYSNYSIPFHPDLFKERVFFKSPNRGDIIIFYLPHSLERYYVKRLIGLPGDKIQLKQGIVYINDIAVHREYTGKYEYEGIFYNKYTEILPNGIKYSVLELPAEYVNSQLLAHNNTEPYYVPEGNYFFMGDNRDNSGDSRSMLGMVEAKYLVAKARFIPYSFAEKLWNPQLGLLGQIKQFWVFITSLRFDRLFHSVYSLVEDERK